MLVNLPFDRLASFQIRNRQLSTNVDARNVNPIPYAFRMQALKPAPWQ